MAGQGAGHSLHVANTAWKPGARLVFCIKCAHFSETRLQNLTQTCEGKPTVSARRNKLRQGFHPLGHGPLTQIRPACAACFGSAGQHSCGRTDDLWRTRNPPPVELEPVQGAQERGQEGGLNLADDVDPWSQLDADLSMENDEFGSWEP